MRILSAYREAGSLYSYSVVEDVLLDVFDIAKSGRLAFRARIRNLQKLGLAPAAPGSGKRMAYSRSDICDLALALSLADLGLDPRRVVDQITPGTTTGIKKGLYCIYLPVWFTKGVGQIHFVSKKSLQNNMENFPRFAVVSIDAIRFRIDAPLHALEKGLH